VPRWCLEQFSLLTAGELRCGANPVSPLESKGALEKKAELEAAVPKEAPLPVPWFRFPAYHRVGGAEDGHRWGSMGAIVVPFCLGSRAEQEPVGPRSGVCTRETARGEPNARALASATLGTAQAFRSTRVWEVRPSHELQPRRPNAAV
jgi:hypothetical protein